MRMNKIAAKSILAISVLVSGNVGVANEVCSDLNISYSFSALKTLAKTAAGKKLIQDAENQIRATSSLETEVHGAYFPIRLGKKQHLTNQAVFQNVVQDFVGTGLYLLPTIYQFKAIDDYNEGGYLENFN